MALVALARLVIQRGTQRAGQGIQVQRKAIKTRVIDCVFENEKDGQYKVIGIHAKRARGLMARYAAQNRITRPGGLEGFDHEGYALAPAVSTPERLVFRRKQ